MKDKVVWMLAIVLAITALLLAGSASYAIVLNSYDWSVNHVRGTANLAVPLAGLLGSIVTGLLSGVVGYVSAKRSQKEESPDDDTESTD
jgi:uncharacterized integral membrane protein